MADYYNLAMKYRDLWIETNDRIVNHMGNTFTIEYGMYEMLKDLKKILEEGRVKLKEIDKTGVKK